jgi:hypothetical protein
MDDPHAFPILPLTFAPATSLDSELLLPITFALASAEEDHISDLEEDIARVATAITMPVLMSRRSDTLLPPSSESVAELEVVEESRDIGPPILTDDSYDHGFQELRTPMEI